MRHVTQTQVADSLYKAYGKQEIYNKFPRVSFKGNFLIGSELVYRFDVMGVKVVECKSHKKIEFEVDACIVGGSKFAGWFGMKDIKGIAFGEIIDGIERDLECNGERIVRISNRKISKTLYYARQVRRMEDGYRYQGFEVEG